MVASLCALLQGRRGVAVCLHKVSILLPSPSAASVPPHQHPPRPC